MSTTPELTLESNSPCKGRVRVDDPSMLLHIGEISGLQDALTKIDALSLKAAGLELAKHVITAQTATLRMRLSQRALRLAAKHGANLAEVNVMTAVDGDGAYVEWSTAEAEAAA